MIFKIISKKFKKLLIYINNEEKKSKINLHDCETDCTKLLNLLVYWLREVPPAKRSTEGRLERIAYL